MWLLRDAFMIKDRGSASKFAYLMERLGENLFKFVNKLFFRSFKCFRTNLCESVKLDESGIIAKE